MHEGTHLCISSLSLQITWVYMWTVWKIHEEWLSRAHYCHSHHFTTLSIYQDAITTHIKYARCGDTHPRGNCPLYSEEYFNAAAYATLHSYAGSSRRRGNKQSPQKQQRKVLYLPSDTAGALCDPTLGCFFKPFTEGLHKDPYLGTSRNPLHECLLKL